MAQRNLGGLTQKDADFYADLVGGLEHDFYFSIYWEESSQLTNIFQRGSYTTN